MCSDNSIQTIQPNKWVLQYNIQVNMLFWKLYQLQVKVEGWNYT